VLLAGAHDRRLRLLDPLHHRAGVAERERATVPLALHRRGLVGVPADDAHRGREELERRRPVVPVEGCDVRVGRGVVAGHVGRLVETGQRPGLRPVLDGPGGLVPHPGLLEDGLDDLAHLLVGDRLELATDDTEELLRVGAADHAVRLDLVVPVGGDDRTEVDVVADGALGAGEDGRHLGLPLEAGHPASLGPVGRVVGEDVAETVPGRLSDGEPGVEVCGHDAPPKAVVVCAAHPNPG
jgi:hypothetical protein